MPSVVGNVRWEVGHSVCSLQAFSALKQTALGGLVKPRTDGTNTWNRDSDISLRDDGLGVFTYP